MRLLFRPLYSSLRPDITSMTMSFSFIGSPMIARALVYSRARVSNCVLRMYSLEEVCSA
ncbi:hypothetical protein HanXRQr2_Chr04g0152141 [Helianthus annuus]|uniref:Uncharacterized protein n=1 Tax=Helianthus annuus TaxID=4232 RepID=A0A9K3J5Y7_HELAN|nr:hypothetical protein HanXRQr2_Chr04g0152141 [Helianthus annuus]KAJ0930193.1 hypothetical protein HanPSC8_Chr04g0146501 [Helianthus annuus]